jgi:hypothetical protein
VIGGLKSHSGSVINTAIYTKSCIAYNHIRRRNMSPELVPTVDGKSRPAFTIRPPVQGLLQTQGLLQAQGLLQTQMVNRRSRQIQRGLSVDDSLQDLRP